MKTRLFVSMLVILWLAGGCAFVSVPLVQTNRPFQEKTIQGEGRDKILLVDVSGTITSQEQTSLTGLRAKPNPVSLIKETLEKAAGDKRIRGIVLRINSPGGTVTASDIIYREIIRFKERKKVPVVACFMDLAASGGYYIAAAADEIVAHPTSVTGSIGVIAMKFNFKGLMDKFGIEEEAIKTGDKKDMMSPFRRITEDEKRIMQEVLDEMHNRFIDVVDRGRPGLTAQEIRKLADGRIFTAEQARNRKLVDRIGYLDDAVQAVQKRAGLQKARVVAYHRPLDYRSNIYSQSSVNIFSFGDGRFKEHWPVQFMYLWNP